MAIISVQLLLKHPASSRMGETFYEFWPRTVIGSFKSAIEIEKSFKT